MKNKRIAFFLPSLAGGGAQRVAINLAEEYCRRGAEVDLVLVRAEGQLLTEVSPGIRMMDLHSRRVLSALFPLADYLRRERPVALISTLDHANLIAIWAKMLAGVKTAVMISTQNQLSIVIRQSPKLQEKLYPYFLRLFQGYAANIVAVSKGVADDLARTAHIPRDRITVIYNPAVRSEMNDLASQPLVHPWFADDQPPVILAVGRLVEQKDYPTLLRAFADLRSHRSVRMVILGEGRLLPDLKTLSNKLNIANEVDFAGFDPNPYRYMARCSVFVLSSAWEGFANVVAEALACGAQIVSTDCTSGPAEILEQGKYGRLVPVGNSAALAEAIAAALDHPLPKDAFRQRGRSFTASAAADQYLEAVGIRLP
jgi:glycosyltransferase involved in cell wall biosynthesis